MEVGQQDSRLLLTSTFAKEDHPQLELTGIKNHFAIVKEFSFGGVVAGGLHHMRSKNKANLMQQVDSSQNSILHDEKLAKPLTKDSPFYQLRAHTLSLLGQARATDAIEFLKRHVRDFYDTCRASVRSAILSL